jgi:hypothetical protein
MKRRAAFGSEEDFTTKDGIELMKAVEVFRPLPRDGRIRIASEGNQLGDERRQETHGARR